MSLLLPTKVYPLVLDYGNGYEDYKSQLGLIRTTHTHTHSHTHTRARTHACTHTRTQTYTHTHTHARTHARTTHTHKQFTLTLYITLWGKQNIFCQQIKRILIICILNS